MIKRFNLTAITMLITTLFIYFWDFWNINGLRQGTEGFYLQIAKEMFESKSFLTPLHNGANHWSKPPLHFWNALAWFHLSGESSLVLARLSNLVFSLAAIAWVSQILKRILSLKFLEVFFFFTSCFGILKYSRIFMMEAPLTFLGFIASLKLYEFLENRALQDLALAAVVAAASCLVKGPVSLVMIFGGAGLFILLNGKDIKKEILPLSAFFTLASFLSSIWFLISWATYGQEFFDYFFLRENLGKFSSKSYPMRVLVQGLFIYALPWSLLFPLLLPSWKRVLSNLNARNIEDRFYLFLLVYFFVFFALWFIPSQRSHHYAMPSIPFFLTMILHTLCQHRDLNEKLLRYTSRFFRGSMTLISSILILVTTLSFFIDDFQNLKMITIFSISIILLSGSIYCIWTQYLDKASLPSLVILGVGYCVIAPSFTLPVVPADIADKLSEKPVITVYRKPYFISESLGRDIQALGLNNMRNHVKNHPHEYLIVRKELYDRYSLNNFAPIQAEWQVWKRGNKFRDIFNAILSGNLSPLKESMVITGPSHL